LQRQFRKSFSNGCICYKKKIVAAARFKATPPARSTDYLAPRNLMTLLRCSSTICRSAPAHNSKASRFSSKYSCTSYTRLMPGFTCASTASPCHRARVASKLGEFANTPLGKAAMAKADGKATLARAGV